MSVKKNWRANSRTDEQKSHSRPCRDGRVRHTTQSPMLPESRAVDVAVTWEESCCSYLGRSCRRQVREKNLNAAVTTNCKKSAEAIVPCVFFFTREGPNNRKSQVQTGRRSEC